VWIACEEHVKNIAREKKNAERRAVQITNNSAL
jgi:hypothetical protein